MEDEINIYVKMPVSVRRALREMAHDEARDEKQQALYIIRHALIVAGYLKSTTLLNEKVNMQHIFSFYRDGKIRCEIVDIDLKSAKEELKRIMGDEYVEPFPDEILIR